MGKKKGKAKRSKSPRNKPQSVQGFDFGHLPTIMFANPSFLEFNRALIDSNVMGCAYGMAPVPGYPGHIPSLSFVCEHPELMKTAFQHFAEWGCRDDGDVVDITIVLKNDGGYLLGLQPNFIRLIERSSPDRELMNPLHVGLTWIKSLDTTNETLREWKALFRSRFFPIEISACTAKLVGGIPSFNTLKPIEEAGSFIKFSLKITTEQEEPDHFLLRVVRNSKEGKGREAGQQGPPPSTPRQIASSRHRVINSAFPMTRERVRRLKIFDRVRSELGYEHTSRAQVEQAVINLLVSEEIAEGRTHYEGIDDVSAAFFDHVRNRSEMAGQNDRTAALSLPAILKQIELDVSHALIRHGASPSDKHATNQRQFARLGYAD